MRKALEVRYGDKDYSPYAFTVYFSCLWQVTNIFESPNLYLNIDLKINI